MTRDTLPGLAIVHGWPIRVDHCFMRVCLDVSLGCPWPAAVKAPAYRMLDDAQLAAAVRIAEGIVRAPNELPVLNEQSLGMRAVWRARGSPRA